MDEPQKPDLDADTTEDLVRLVNPLHISDLISGQGATFEVNPDENEAQQETDFEIAYSPDEVLQYSNPACCDLVDEDVYQEGEPFEKLAKYMTNIVEDGGVKKRILRDGYGSEVTENSVVTINYNAYVEYNDEPFDSTYLRRKPQIFHVGQGLVILGVDIAVKSMKMNEQAQFLIEPKYAYGEYGCLQRIPANATILYEIELKNIVDSGAAHTYSELDEARKLDFSEIYKYAHALCSKANDLYSKGLIRQATKEYSIAVSKLERCTLGNYEEQEKQQQLLLRLLTNLVVAYTKLQEPRRACINCNKIYNMSKGTSLRVPTKVYFNHARCLIQLSDFEWAERKLRQAKKLEPHNKDIAREFIKLDAKKKECYNKEVALAKSIFKNTEINKELDDKNEVTQEFCASMRQYCNELLDDTQSTQYNLPGNLTEKELEFCRKLMPEFGLELQESKNAVEKYFICKMEQPN